MEDIAGRFYRMDCNMRFLGSRRSDNSAGPTVGGMVACVLNWFKIQCKPGKRGNYL